MLKNTIRVIGSFMCIATTFAHIPVLAETACQPLTEVSTGQTEITKKVDLISIRNNFNTDFGIPSGSTFKTYQGTMTVQNAGKYKVAINLKYPDGSVSTAYEKEIPMTPGEVYTLDFESPIASQPYQVNFNVSGANNNAYTISVQACP